MRQDSAGEEWRRGCDEVFSRVDLKRKRRRGVRYLAGAQRAGLISDGDELWWLGACNTWGPAAVDRHPPMTFAEPTFRIHYCLPLVGYILFASLFNGIRVANGLFVKCFKRIGFVEGKVIGINLVLSASASIGFKIWIKN